MNSSMSKGADYPVRVAHVIGKLNAAGVEAVVNNYYRHINHSKYQFDYFIDADSTCPPPKELIELGARYYVVPPYQNLFAHVRALVHYFRMNKYMIVHSGMNTLAPISLFAAKIAGVPIRINHNHSTAGRGEFKRNCLKYALRLLSKLFATDYCACSEYAGIWLFGKSFFKKGMVTVFKNAVDTSVYSFNQTVRENVRNELGIDSRFVVGHVGRFCTQKNHSFLIEVFEKIHKINSNAILILAGIGELQDEVKKQVHSKNLDEYVLFLGRRTDCSRLYQAMDVFVCPSLYEGLPVVGVEAQSCGIPCVFSDQVTKEVKMASNVEMLSLSETADFWAQTILRVGNGGVCNNQDVLINSGFDIKIEAGKLEQYYDNKLVSFYSCNQTF